LSRKKCAVESHAGGEEVGQGGHGKKDRDIHVAKARDISDTGINCGFLVPISRG